MDRWAIHMRVACVELFLRNNSITETQRRFRYQFQHRNAPSRNTILQWVTKWRLTGSVRDEYRVPHRHSVTTPGNTERVIAAVTRSPRRSIVRQALALRLSDRSVRRMLHQSTFQNKRVSKL